MTIISWSLSISSGVAQSDEPPRLRAGTLSGSLRVDGVLDEPAWRTAEVIEQFAQAVLGVATKASIMLHGHITRTGDPASIAEELTAAYLGATH